MSISVIIRTDKHPEPKEVFEALMNRGERIIITSPEYPSVKFGNLNTALRGIEVNEEENGIEVRICSFGSADDYRLYGKTVDAVMKLTGGKAYYEDDDEDEVTNPLVRFDDQWVDSERESMLNMYRILCQRYGNEITLYGLFTPICIGPRLLSDFDIWDDDVIEKEEIDRLQNYLVSVQWHLANKEDTSTRMVMPDPEDPDGRGKSISLITIKDGKVSNFDYISHAQILCLMDMDNRDVPPVLVPFEAITKILPEEGFRILDEYQFERTEELTPETFRQIMENARIYQPDDLLHIPVKPGEGYDETQNTVILMWNPAISSVKLEDHNNSIPNLFTEVYNWSVWEHEKAKCGDRFFLVRCGEGNTGIVMSGVFDSHPYEAGDWSGRGRRTFYMDMKPNVILNPDKAPMLTTAELEKEIPGFQWSGGHSGRILPPKDAEKLEEMWQVYLKKNHDAIDGVTMNAVGQYEVIE